MQIEEVQNTPVHLSENIPALRPDDKTETSFRPNQMPTSSPLSEWRGYIPSVFSGINTSGSYHVYGHLHAPFGKLADGHNISALPKGGTIPQTLCSQVTNGNMAGTESTTIIHHPVPSHPNSPTSIIHPLPCSARQPGAFRGFQRPASPMGEENLQHLQPNCIDLPPGCGKGVICSPQSPHRSDCQPNSPTESVSSRNAALSLNQPSGCPQEAKAHNWKKYKFIVMNQTSDEKEEEAQGGRAETGAYSPTSSPYDSSGSDGHIEIQSGERSSEHGELPLPQIAHHNSCRNIR